MIVGIEALDQMSNIIVTFGRIKFEATVIATLKGWRFLGSISMESITGHCAGLLLTGLIVPIVQYAFKQHSRERKLAAFFWQVRVLTDSNKSQKAHPGGFEPPTLGSEDRCSIQLSHGCVRENYSLGAALLGHSHSKSTPSTQEFFAELISCGLSTKSTVTESVDLREIWS